MEEGNQIPFGDNHKWQQDLDYKTYSLENYYIDQTVGINQIKLYQVGIILSVYMN